MKGKLIILTGFSGSGKDTLMEMLLKTRPKFRRIITHTSRPIRPNERYGKDYYFVSHEEFENMIKEDKFIEHVMYGSHYKGTLKDEFQKVFLGQNIIWRIDMGRAAIVENTFLEKFDKETATNLISVTKKIIITVSPEEALKRFKKREGIKADFDEFKKRINDDLTIWENSKNNFPNVVENMSDELDKTLDKIIKIIDLKA